MPLILLILLFIVAAVLGAPAWVLWLIGAIIAVPLVLIAVLWLFALAGVAYVNTRRW